MGCVFEVECRGHVVKVPLHLPFKVIGLGITMYKSDSRIISRRLRMFTLRGARRRIRVRVQYVDDEVTYYPGHPKPDHIEISRRSPS